MIATSSRPFGVANRNSTRLTALACAALALIAARAPLTGEWGGSRVKLTLTTTGGKLEQDCGSFVLKQPIAPGRSGRFSAKGFFEKTIGPMRLEQPMAPRAAFSGWVSGDLIHLDVRVDGETEPRHYQLHRGQPVELFACM
jgi:hypothetical protein